MQNAPKKSNETAITFSIIALVLSLITGYIAYRVGRERGQTEGVSVENMHVTLDSVFRVACYQRDISHREMGCVVLDSATMARGQGR